MDFPCSKMLERSAFAQSIEKEGSKEYEFGCLKCARIIRIRIKETPDHCAFCDGELAYILNDSKPIKIRCITNKADHINANRRAYSRAMLETIADHINSNQNSVFITTDNGKLELTKAVGSLSKANVSDDGLLMVEGNVFGNKADIVRGAKLAPSGFGKVENGVVTEFKISHMFLALDHADEHATEIEFIEE